MKNGVYEIRVNGIPVYVGESKDIDKRCSSHEKYATSASRGRYTGTIKLWFFLGRALNRDHLITFHVITTGNFTKPQRMALEKERINEVEAVGHLLKFNKQHRGMSKRSRKKISVARTGKSQGTWSWSEEAKARHSETMKIVHANKACVQANAIKCAL